MPSDPEDTCRVHDDPNAAPTCVRCWPHGYDPEATTHERTTMPTLRSPDVVRVDRDLARIIVRQAIVTHYKGPTNTRGACIIARTGGGHRMVVPWNYELEPAQNHAAGACALLAALGWDGVLNGGATPDGYAWTIVDSFAQCAPARVTTSG